MGIQKNIGERVSHVMKRASKHSKISKILVYFELLRTRNCVITFLGVYLGVAVVLGTIPGDAAIFIAASAAFLITGGGNALNDYFDCGIDKINKPHRPLPSGRITKNDASMLGMALILIGIWMANSVNQYCLYLAILNSIMLVVYAVYSKKLLLVSNLCVSYMVASVFLFGGLATGSIAGMDLLVILIACSFLMTLSREVVKDIEDIEGDKRRYAVTLPINLGVEKSRNIAISFALAAVALSALPLILNLLKNPVDYAVFIAAADIMFAYTVFSLEPKDAQRIMVLGMVIAIIAFFVGALA